MNQKEGIANIEKNEKLQRWEEARQEIDQIADKLGKGIDANIKETIAVFHVLNINTKGSCEGHVNRGTFAPYVDIESQDIDDLENQLDEIGKALEKAKAAVDFQVTLENAKEKANQIYKEIERKNLAERKKVMAYLEEFYENRHVPYHQRLILEGLARGWTRLESQGVDLQKIESDEIKQQRLIEYQNEMKAFTEFLKEKYFGKKE